MTSQELYRVLRKLLCQVTPEADAEARLILCHFARDSWSHILLRFSDKASHAEAALDCANERLGGRPLAYILGERAFFGDMYLVDERVLIPRFDSECVVEAACGAVRERGLKTVADVCCGSGCLGISLARQCDLVSLTLSDISDGALEVARLNAKRLLPNTRLTFVRADLLDGLTAPVDLLVCNPPYVGEAEYDTLERQVRDYEPALALVAPDNGLAFYSRLAREAKPALSPMGVLVAEFGDTQEEAVHAIFRDAGWGEVHTGKDFSGKPRFLRASLE